MNCPVCLAAGEASDRFCRRCGCILSFPCTNCGRTLRAGDQFCGNCGTALTAAGAPPAVQHTISIGSSTGQSRGGIGGLEIVGERKVVTVMFADIVGSTQLIQGLDPEQSMRLLDPALQLMYVAVRRHHGTVKIQGDGIVALFGAPFAHEDHAVEACLAALALAEGARALADLGIQIRVGLNSGPVVVRAIPGDNLMNYDAIGPTVHLAARMEQSCRPGSVRLTGHTYHLAAHAISVNPLGSVSVKGLSAGVETYELLGAASPSEGPGRAPRSHRSRFVGRAPELAALRHSMELCAVGFGQVVSIVGSAGIGKTRLVLEFARRLPESWQQLTCGGTPYGESISYHPLRSLLRTWCGIREAAGDHIDSVAKARRAVSALDYDIGADFAPLCTLLDLPADDPGWRSTEPRLRQRRIAAAIVKLIVAMSRLRPLALIVEDLHWIDAETQSVLHELACGIAPHKILLICTHRPESRGLWSTTADQRWIEVQSLERPHAQLLIDNLLGADVRLDHLKQLIFKRGGGIPLFIEEIANSLIEAGDLKHTENGYRLLHPIDQIRIPDSLQTLIASRIDRIGARLKHTLQIASVVGNEVPARLVADMFKESHEQIAAELRQLEGADFLRQTRTGPDPLFVFKHALIRDVAYESLLSDQRRILHRSVIAALEAQPVALLDDQVERVAHHALSGELWAKAVEYCRKAADKAHEYSALSDGIRFLEQALSALDRVPRTAETVGLSVDLHVQLRRALWSVGRVAEANAHLDDAERLAKTLDDKTRIAVVGVIRTQIFNSEGNLEAAVAAGRRARSVARMVGNESLAIAAEFFLSQSHFFRGDLQQAIMVLEPLRTRVTGELRHERLGTSMTTSVLYLVNQARAYSLLGDFPQARALAGEAEAIAREVDRPFDLGFSLHAVGNIAVDAGDYEGALHILKQALELCRSRGFRPLFPLVACPLGLALACLGDVKRGTELLAEAALTAQQSRLIFYEVWSAAYTARTYLETQAFDAALSVASTALPKATEMNFRFLEIWLRRVAGATATDSGALAHLQRAVVLATELGARPDLAHCRWALADLCDRLGRYGEADAERVAASDLYRAIDMRRRFGVTPAAPRVAGERSL